MHEVPGGIWFMYVVLDSIAADLSVYIIQNAHCCLVFGLTCLRANLVWVVPQPTSTSGESSTMRPATCRWPLRRRTKLVSSARMPVAQVTTLTCLCTVELGLTSAGRRR